MARLQTLKWDNLIRGDSSAVAWQIKYRDKNGDLQPKSLVGYKAALTIKQKEWDNSYTDIIPDPSGSKAAEGYDGALAVINIDCDDEEQMHYIPPEQGRILFDLHKQAMWLTPGSYYLDIVLENKASKRTHTYVLATLTVQGHPTNRLTTDDPDTYDDVRTPEEV